MIPYTIYRTWQSSELPRSFRTAWEFTQASNPGYRQHLFDDRGMERFMREHYHNQSAWADGVYRAFASISPSYGTARADVFRYALLYKRGGVYLDAKSAARNVSAVIGSSDRFLVSRWPPTSIVRLWSAIHLGNIDGEYQQWWLAAAPQHPAMKSVLDSVVSRVEEERSTKQAADDWCAYARSVVGDDSLLLYLVPQCNGVRILWTTGPFAFTRGVDTYGARADIRTLAPNGDGAFIYDYVGDHRKYGGHYYAKGERLLT